MGFLRTLFSKVGRGIRAAPSALSSKIVHTYKRPKVVQKRLEGRICGICLGMMKEGLASIQCGCGKSFHVSCATRLGHCPVCSSTIQEVAASGGIKEKGIEVDHEFFPIPKLRLTNEEKLELLEERLILGEITEETYKELKSKYEAGMKAEWEYQCPSCGRYVEESATVCECGSIFSEERIENAFLCPECDKILPWEASYCESCGVRFVEEQFSCPRCGNTLVISDRQCSCGLQFKDEIVQGFYCPSCQSFQLENNLFCTSCGVRFSEGEEIYQCPECDGTVSSDTTQCSCGAFFDKGPGELTEYQCPQCGTFVEENSSTCHGCGAKFQ